MAVPGRGKKGEQALFTGGTAPLSGGGRCLFWQGKGKGKRGNNKPIKQFISGGCELIKDIHDFSIRCMRIIG